MGGRASGPGPLDDLFKFTVELFQKAQGRHLFPIECHDLMCKIGEIVVVGGVRRSARSPCRTSTTIRWHTPSLVRGGRTRGQRALANNSVAYKGKPEMGTFMREWVALYESKSGERGLFNRQAAVKQAARNGRRKVHDRPLLDDTDRYAVHPHRTDESFIQFGTNPCSRSSSVRTSSATCQRLWYARRTLAHDLKRKVRLATILGTLQSTLTDFKYLRKVWKTNTEEERLLGVSLTGIMDHPFYQRTSIPLAGSKR